MTGLHAVQDESRGSACRFTLPLPALPLLPLACAGTDAARRGGPDAVWRAPHVPGPGPALPAPPERCGGDARGR
jgi:hypothetical protein